MRCSQKRGDRGTDIMKHEQMCREILPLVGGRENITQCYNCMTRLRLVLADLGKADLEALKKVQGVLGVNVVGQQVQCIVGQKAGTVCKEFCEIAGIAQDAAVKDPELENADARMEEKKSFSWKSIPNTILDVMSNCIQPLLPIIICASMFKLMCTLLGPTVLNLVSESSDVYRLFTFVGDVPFYFLPVLVGYTSAKYFGVSIPMGVVMGGILLHPTFTQIVSAGEPFTVYGIPMQLVDYSSSIVPVLLCVWIMSYVDKFFQKHLPEMLKFMLAHFLTFAVMLPVGLCVLAPAGNVIATAIAGAFVKIPEYLGPVGVGLVCLVWPLLVAVGMHMPVAMLAFATFLTVGHEDVCFVADNLQHWVAMGVALAFALRSVSKDDRNLGVSSFVSMFLGGVIEPTIFGIAFPHKKYLAALLLANGIAGFFAGLTGVGAYALSSSNVFGILSFSGGTTHNFVFGILSAVLAFAGGFVISFILDLAPKKSAKT